MNITDFIVELLQKGKKVEIPNMGTLSAEQGFIQFSNETIGDRSIIDAISRKECIDPKIAEAMWKNYVDALNDKMRREGCHDFPGIGTLKCSYNTFSFDVANHTTPNPPSSDTQRPTATIYSKIENEEDPFSVFEQPLKPIIEEPEPVPEPEPELIPEPKPEPVSEAEPIPEPIPETKIEPEPDATPLPIQESHPQSAETPKSAQTANPEPIQSPISEPTIEPTPVSPAKRETFAENIPTGKDVPTDKDISTDKDVSAKQEDVLAVLDSIKPTTDNTNSTTPIDNNNDKKKKGWIWLLIILLVLLLAGGACYYFNCYKTGKSPKEFVSSLISKSDASSTEATMKNADSAITEKTADVKNTAKQESDSTTVAPEAKPLNDFAETYKQVVNDFTFNKDLIEFSQKEIDANTTLVRRFMNSYIQDYLAARRYTAAYDAVMNKVNEYTQSRLSQLLTPASYSVTRFIPYEDYMRGMVMDELHSSKANRARCMVQSELMERSYLDAMLTSLVAELGIQQDAAPAPKVKTAPVEPVYNATIINTSKKGYDVIAGFFTNKNNAMKMAQNLKRQGCDAYIIDKNGMYYVSMGSASSQTAIDATYKHIKSWYHGDASIKKW